MTPTVLDILRKTRELAEDPERFCVNPNRAYENTDGTAPATFYDAYRGCMIGLQGIASRMLNVECGSATDVATCNAIDAVLADRFSDGVQDMYGNAMRAPHAERLAVYDEAIRRAESS